MAHRRLLRPGDRPICVRVGLVLDLALEEFDFVGRQVEESVNAIVDFSVSKRAGEPFDFGAFLGKVGLPLVGGGQGVASTIAISFAVRRYSW